MRAAGALAAALAALALLPGCVLLRPTPRTPIYPRQVTPGGVSVQDLIVPEEGPEAGPESMVSIHYAIWTGMGQLVDSSYDRGLPIEFRIGDGAVPPGLEEGLIGMRRGGQRSLIVPPELGYGEAGVIDAVPPGSFLVIRVELIDIL